MRLAWIGIVLAGSVFGQSSAEKQRASVALQQASQRRNGVALAAYNSGPGRVDRAGGTPAIAETQDYVKAILGKLGSAPKDPLDISMPKPVEP